MRQSRLILFMSDPRNQPEQGEICRAGDSGRAASSLVGGIWCLCLGCEATAGVPGRVLRLPACRAQLEECRLNFGDFLEAYLTHHSAGQQTDSDTSHFPLADAELPERPSEKPSAGSSISRSGTWFRYVNHRRQSNSPRSGVSRGCRSVCLIGLEIRDPMKNSLSNQCLQWRARWPELNTE
jgi:hypothetical protein